MPFRFYNNHKVTCTTECSKIYKKQKIEKQQKGKRVICSLPSCSKEFYIPQNRIDRCKSGYFFCSKEHQVEARGVLEDFKTGPKVDEKNGIKSYRKTAFAHKEHKCSLCGYHYDEKLLEVHHINGNRNNNRLENLIILCTWCHRVVTFGYVEIINGSFVIKKDVGMPGGAYYGSRF